MAKRRKKSKAIIEKHRQDALRGEERRKRRVQQCYGERNHLIQELGFSSYDQYLQSPLWKQIRARVLEQYPYCRICRRYATQVHHGSYTPENLRGETMRNLWALCGTCHFGIEYRPDGLKVSVNDATRRMHRQAKKQREKPRKTGLRHLAPELNQELRHMHERLNMLLEE